MHFMSKKEVMVQKIPKIIYIQGGPHMVSVGKNKQFRPNVAMLSYQYHPL